VFVENDSVTRQLIHVGRFDIVVSVAANGQRILVVGK
jgi:hypothetical protein